MPYSALDPSLAYRGNLTASTLGDYRGYYVQYYLPYLISPSFCRELPRIFLELRRPSLVVAGEGSLAKPHEKASG